MMLKSFRVLGQVEGISLVALLFVAMPAKYYFGNASLVPVIGMAHGLLFMAYCAMSLAVSHRQQWSLGFWLLALLASVTPFAFLLLDRRLRADTDMLLAENS